MATPTGPRTEIINQGDIDRSMAFLTKGFETYANEARRKEELERIEEEKEMRRKALDDERLRREAAQDFQTSLQLSESLGTTITPDQIRVQRESLLPERLRSQVTQQPIGQPQAGLGGLQDIQGPTVETPAPKQIPQTESRGIKSIFESISSASRRKKAEAKNKEVRAATNEIRKEVSGLQPTKDLQKITASYEKIKAASEKPSAAGDLSLIFNYMKILDPGSVVRESEFANAAQARAALSRFSDQGIDVPAFIVQGVQKLETGQLLLPAQREDFVNSAASAAVAQLNAFEESVRPQIESAKEQGLDLSKIIPKTDILQKARSDIQAKELRIAEQRAQPLSANLPEGFMSTQPQGGGFQASPLMPQESVAAPMDPSKMSRAEKIKFLRGR